MKIHGCMWLSMVLLVSCISLDAMTQREKIAKSKNAQKSYEQLIKPSKYFGKDTQQKNLEMLGALLMQKGITRIQTTLEGYLGKENIEYKNMLSVSKNLGKSLDAFLPVKAWGIPQVVYDAFLWATGELILDETAVTYYKYMKATDLEMSQYQKKYNKKISASRLVVLFDQELNALNNTYAPILNTIKALGRKTIFPPITELKVLYKNALSKSN